VAEVRRRLLSAGYAAPLVDGAVDRLLQLELLDDGAFARSWVESRDRAHPRGRRALRQELSLKGIDRETIAGVLDARDELAIEDDASPDATAAARLMERHARALARIANPAMRRQRAYALLARNGFDPEICRTVAAGVVADLGPDDGPDDGPPDLDA
jgi:regulatory protein